MPRTATILGLLLALALIVAGASWIGAPAESEDAGVAIEAADETVEPQPDVVEDDHRDDAALIDMLEPESVTRVAIGSAPPAAPAGDAPPRAGAVQQDLRG